MRASRWLWAGVTAASLALAPGIANSMCGYFSRPVVQDVKQSPVLQPSQIAFITWDPEKEIETVTVQPRFEGNALDFGMVIPTPAQPKLHEMPRDFFKALGVYTTPKRRAYPESKLMPRFDVLDKRLGGMAREAAGGGGKATISEPRPTTVLVLETGLVGSLDYKIISAERPDDLYQWLKDNEYSYSGDEATLAHYVKQKWFFTVMKIDTLQMKKNKDGTYSGDVTPTRFTFSSPKLVYPMKITQVSVKDKTEALFYVQAPKKFDLPGDQSYQFHWLSSLQQVAGTMGPQELLERNQKWLKAVQEKEPKLLQRGGELGFSFALGQRPTPNKQGRSPATLEWAKRLSADDIGILTGDRPFSETVSDPDAGFLPEDLRDGRLRQAIYRVIQHRLDKCQKDRPRGYLVRDASKEEQKLLPILKGHLTEGQYLTKFYRVFTRAEMSDDLLLAPAQAGQVEDQSEHEEVLRTLVWQGRRPPRFRELEQLLPR